MNKKTDKRKEELWKTVKNWIEKMEPTCGESICQSDRFAAAVFELVVDVCDTVGYVEIEYD